MVILNVFFCTICHDCQRVLKKVYEETNIFPCDWLQRFNVAVTRAKALLIVIGNPAVLQYDANWFSFISYCVENGAVLGSKFSLDPRTDWSRVRKFLAKKHVATAECDPNMPFQVVEEVPVEKRSLPLPQNHAERRRRVPKRDSACEEIPATDASPVSSSGMLAIVKLITYRTI